MVTLRFDGLYRGVTGREDSPSTAGLLCYGWLITADDVVIARGHGACLRGRNATSNVAEYLALIEGLDALYDLGVRDELVLIQGDAKTIIDQMRGVSMVNSPVMKPLYQRAKDLADRFANLSWTWRPRRENKAADLLTRRAMRQIRMDSRQYQEALQAIDPADRSRRKTDKLHTLMDLRVFQSIASR